MVLSMDTKYNMILFSFQYTVYLYDYTNVINRSENEVLVNRVEVSVHIQEE